MSETRTFVADVAFAMTVRCPHCGREAGLPCMAADSSDRSYPHLPRFRIGDKYRELREQQTRK